MDEVTAWSNPYRLEPALPTGNDLEDLRDLASEVYGRSRDLEAKLAPETAQEVGDKLRIINSLFSNQIEGYFTTYLEIENRLGRKNKELTLVPITGDKYAAELGEAHVKAEASLARMVADQPDGNVSHPDFIRYIHKRFYSELPAEHQTTHGGKGFSDIPVMPGEFRDHPVKLVSDNNDSLPIGPKTKTDLLANMNAFGRIFDPANFQGVEAKIIAAAAGHAKLAWLHPFRDGNGRTARLYTSLFLARCGINKTNLWSLSRGLAEKKGRYFTGLRVSNPSPSDGNRKNLTFNSEDTAAGCNIFLTICKDQIAFMESQLMLNSINERIERFAETQLGNQFSKHKTDAGRVLRVVYANGRVERQELYSAVLGRLGERTAQSIVSGLLAEGYLKSESHKSSVTIGLPPKALREYFPRVYDEKVMDAAKKSAGVKNEKAVPAATPKARGSGFDLER